MGPPGHPEGPGTICSCWRDPPSALPWPGTVGPLGLRARSKRRSRSEEAAQTTVLGAGHYCQYEGNEISVTVACACMRIGRACNGSATTVTLEH
jgi:hypothetical protein